MSNVCGAPAPYQNLTSTDLYKGKHKLPYPINVARNIAREAALTHYVFVSDIELYPSPDVPMKFLKMIARNDNNNFKRSNPRIYPLPIFEIKENVQVPTNKTELQMRYEQKDLIIFHANICRNCHAIPQFDNWIRAKESSELSVFTIAKRTGAFVYWEPIFIGTNNDPIYDERLIYEMADDKMPQVDYYFLEIFFFSFFNGNIFFFRHMQCVLLIMNSMFWTMLFWYTNQASSN